MDSSENPEDQSSGYRNEPKIGATPDPEEHALAEALCDIAALLNSTLKLDEVLDRILGVIGKVVPHDAANIMLIENETCRIVRLQGYRERGLEEGVKALKIRISDVQNLKVMMNGRKPLVIQDTATYPGWITFPITSWIRSYVSAPILVNDQAVGFLNLDSETPGFYQPIHGERLLAFANQAAVALHNAQLYEKLQQMAITDELTGHYNRRGLFQLGQREIDRALRFLHPLSLLMVDIDAFKSFNDSYSYIVGDEVLKLVADRIRENVREVDIVGRYGGDEFTILLIENDLSSANQVADRLQKAIREKPFATSRGDLAVSVSIGVVPFTPSIKYLTTLIEKAGLALHAVKQARHPQ